MALCTYNGGRYLGAQLDSLVAQTVQPSEVVACDDGSTDETIPLLEGFKRRAPFAVRVERNPTNLGSTKNFEKAISLCTGDLIATCDQDDIWLPEKLALSRAWFEEDRARGLVFSNAEVVDEALCPVGHTMWDAIHLGPFQRRRLSRGDAFPLLLKKWLVTGATMMFRADLKPCFLPIPEIWIHDGWIAFIIGALAPVGIIDRCLVKYRQHPAQQIGGQKLSLGELYQKARREGPAQYRLARGRFLLARERLRGQANRLHDSALWPMLDEKVSHQERRLAISECQSRAKRLWWAVGELLRGRYSRCSPDLRHFLKDALL